MPATGHILDDALGAVGETPLIRLDRLAKLEGLKCNLRKCERQLYPLSTDECCHTVGKVEYMSAGGSVKDRIAKRMVEEAEKVGRLIPGKSVVIEPTSGNTGTSLVSKSTRMVSEARYRHWAGHGMCYQGRTTNE